MKNRWSFRLLSGAVALVLLLLSVKLMAVPCDEDCNAEAPTCECICVCYGESMAMPACDALPRMNVVRYAVQRESLRHGLLLTHDIFRPPIG